MDKQGKNAHKFINKFKGWIRKIISNRKSPFFKLWFWILLIWCACIAVDAFNLPQKIMVISKRDIHLYDFNMETWGVIATITSGVLTYWSVYFTIKNNKEEREADIVRLENERLENRRELEADRREEEKKKVTPYIALAGSRGDTGFKYNLVCTPFPNNNMHSRGKITALNNSICILTGIVLGSKKTDFPKVVFDANIIVDLNISKDSTGKCYLIGEDIYGNKYRYSLKFNGDDYSSQIIEIGMPTEYQEEGSEV